MEKFLPVILGTDSNAYGLARSFYEKYQVKSLALGKVPLIETRKSKIVDVKVYDKLTDENVFKKVLLNIGKEYKKKYDKLILLSCAEWYTNLIVNNRKTLENYFIVPFMSKKLKNLLESKDSFYNMCEKYNLDYPSTYVINYDSRDEINIPFNFPVALKPASSKDYSEVSFEGKEKSYKLNNIDKLKETVKRIYNSGYRSNIIVQDFIPGNDDSMWVINSYSNKHGKVKMMCLGRCILEEHTPYGIGNYKAIISDGDEVLYSKIKNFLEDIKYVGFANFDIKYDYRDKKYKLFEINIRQGRSSFFTTCAGLNLSKYIVDDYVYNKDNETVYNYNKFLWLATPKGLLKKYVYNLDALKEANDLIRKGKYDYTLKYSKDCNLYRWFWINRIYLKDYKLFKLYPPRED